MSALHVLMLLSNGYAPDVRAQKEAHTLAAAGWRVTILAWDRGRRYPVHMREQAPFPLAAMLRRWEGRRADPIPPVTITRLHIPAAYGTGKRLLRALPRFWARAYQELRRARPDVVHAHDLDTLPLAWWYARGHNVPLIYDAREYYPGMVRRSVGEALSAALERLDRALTPRADAVLTVGERLAARLRGVGGRVWVVHNAQPLPADRAALHAEGRALRRKIGVPPHALLVLYVGYLNPDRLLTPLLDAVPHVPNVWFAVAGTGPQSAEVRAAARRCARIVPLGWVNLADVPRWAAAADVLYYGLDAHNANSHYFMPNAAFFAFAVGRPLLVTPTGEIAELLRREGGGLVLERADAPIAQDALRRLCEPATRATLTVQARALGEERYNWAHAAQRLLAAYTAARR